MLAPLSKNQHGRRDYSQLGRLAARRTGALGRLPAVHGRPAGERALTILDDALKAAFWRYYTDDSIHDFYLMQYFWPYCFGKVADATQSLVVGSRSLRSVRVLMASCLLASCAAKAPMTLMPTPVLYRNAVIDPFAHLDQTHRTTTSRVYFFTNRAARIEDGSTLYLNQMSDAQGFGQAVVRMGQPGFDWTSLVRQSLADLREIEVELSVAAVDPFGELPGRQAISGSRQALAPGLGDWLDQINADLDRAVDREILVYVHGAKVDFDNAAILTAEVDHFAGRDFVGVAFAWPSHQNILSYLVGTDVERARASSSALRNLLTLLARYTHAEHINLLSYSAGGRVTSKALSELRQRHPELTPEQLKSKYRLGAVVFAAADVELDVFLERLPEASELAQQVVITVADNDKALVAARRFMGGEARAGTADAEKQEIGFIAGHRLPNVEILDVSNGKEIRGFDIEGHHYWYRHPWTSSDVIFLMRTDLPPHQRGLSPAAQAGVWYLSTDYPERVIDAARTQLDGKW
jgi:esterase/lipase superfamily enzyme